MCDTPPHFTSPAVGAGALTGAAVAIAIPNTMHPRGWGDCDRQACRGNKWQHCHKADG